MLINNPNIFDNSLCENNTGINEFAYAAYEDDKIVSISGASSNTENLWWIGVDTVVEHRGHGLAGGLVNKVKNEVLSLNKIPIYPTWYANIPSRKTAILSGFMPRFVEISSE